MLPQVPERLQKRIEKMGGKAPDGQPLFRVVRGHDRMTVMGGRWKKHDPSGNITGEFIGTQVVPKYADALERYVFEMLCPPENYGTPEQWEEQFTQMIDGQRIETLGPYPRHGEYELVKVIETPTKRAFVPLTEAICDALVTTAKLNRDLPAQVKVEAKREQDRRNEAQRVAKQVDMINSFERPDWARNPHVVLPSDMDVAKFSTGRA